MLLSEGDRILSDDCFAGRSMGGDKNRVSHFQMVNRVLLEYIELERILRNFSWPSLEVAAA